MSEVLKCFTIYSRLHVFDKTLLPIKYNPSLFNHDQMPVLSGCSSIDVVYKLIGARFGLKNFMSRKKIRGS